MRAVLKEAVSIPVDSGREESFLEEVGAELTLAGRGGKVKSIPAKRGDSRAAQPWCAREVTEACRELSVV